MDYFKIICVCICVYLKIQMYQPVKKALQSIGNRGKYQKLLIVLLFFIASQVNYLIFGPTFIFMDPLFKCSFTDDLVDQSIACNRLSQCTINTDFTIVASAKLYCDKQFDRNLIQSISSLGAIFGLIGINYLSDLKGRKLGLIVAQCFAIFGVSLTILGGYTASTAILTISQFFCGFSGYSLIIMAYILPSEYCEQQFREKTIIIINYSWAITIIIIGLLYYFQSQWYNYLILFILIPMIGVFLISLFFIVEGPNFLYGAKREKQCLQALREIAVYNNTLRQYQTAAQNFKYESSQVMDRDQKQNLMKVLKNKYYLKMFVVLIFVDIGGNIYYVGSNYALDLIGIDYGTNMLSGGVIEFFSFLFMQFTISKMPRKKGLTFTYLTTSILGLLFFIEPLRESKIGSLVIIGVCRFIGIISYTLLVMFLTQSFPMKVQAICAGIIESVAQLGSFLGPIVITLCINFQIYPLIMLSFILFLLVVIPLLTLSLKNPDQVLLDENNETLIQSTSNQITP